jgi:hypothetical protein
VVRVGQAVDLDAGASWDYQTSAADLEVSWDDAGAASQPPAYPAPAAPWTGWTTAKERTTSFAAAGTYPVRVAVRDAAGDVGYAVTTVVVLDPMDPKYCLVDTDADLDDGASSCTGPSNRGADGRLSLAEALRLATGGEVVAFAFPMTITGTSPYTIAKPVTVLGPGVALDGISLIVKTGNAATPVRLVGLELRNLAAQITVQNKKALALVDVVIRDGAGLLDSGTVTLDRVRMERCAGACIRVTDDTGADTLTIRHSELASESGGVGVDLAQCDSNKLALAAQSSLFRGFATAIQLGCAGRTTVVHGTFHGNGTAIGYYAGGASPSHVLRNSLFTGNSTAATCGTSTFTARDRHLVWPPASAGCLAGDPETLGADPLYLNPAAGDFRLSLLPTPSPAIDAGVDLSLYLLAAFPPPNPLPAPLPAAFPRFLGAAPDRGAFETW